MWKDKYVETENGGQTLSFRNKPWQQYYFQRIIRFSIGPNLCAQALSPVSKG